MLNVTFQNFTRLFDHHMIIKNHSIPKIKFKKIITIPFYKLQLVSIANLKKRILTKTSQNIRTIETKDVEQYQFISNYITHQN